ncbi:YkvI family membrane protein [Acidaminobacter hydrogenoformans]|uniref:Uncharacterized membrane protein YkvI n=1 Tax=Acidaminobacter hydrogenoformans DSM 2784 TaxID=1120920 RepID=A0A1G5RQW2_9FIRM|nr:hypothetical protein [Acidaminobacter hydrogenoformans]SCZ76472.1 Uncharacterized membrane protein YkvI [Acidaminobacter hydrogenoformans DSM 2784]
MSEQKLSIKTITIYAGAFIAFLIGSGFATGQEIMQYFVAYGFKGILGAIVVFLLFLYVGISFITTGFDQKFHKGSEIYEHYCGKYIGKFFDYFSIAFIYMSFIVMVGGAGATLNQQYGLPIEVGGIGLGILAATTVVFGLKGIVDVIGKIGPVITVMAIFLGLAAIIQNPGGLAKASAAIPSMNLLKASSNWVYAAGSYVGFCMLWLAAFMASMGASAKSRKEASMGAIFGAVGFSLAVIIMALGLMANVDQVAGTQVPSLILAGNIHPTLAIIFSLTVIAGIYTTSVPLLWSVIARFSEEKTKRFTIMTGILAAVGVFVGLRVPFDRLVNIIYVINGYVGIFLLAIMLVRSARRIMAGKASKSAVETE